MILNPTYLRALSTIQGPKKARHAHLDGVQLVQDSTVNGTLTYTTTNGHVLARVTHRTGLNPDPTYDRGNGRVRQRVRNAPHADRTGVGVPQLRGCHLKRDATGQRHAGAECLA